MATNCIVSRVEVGTQVEILRPSAAAALLNQQQPFVDLGYNSLQSTPKQLPPARAPEKVELESNNDTDENVSNTSCENSFRWTDGFSLLRDCKLLRRMRFGSSHGEEKKMSEAEDWTAEARPEWDKKMDFLLSIIGFAVDLANVWRFPYLCYKNGGGVFLIPYTLMLLFGALPLFFMELSLGQFAKAGPINVWDKIYPAMKGVGYCSVLISWYVSFYYNVIIGWTVYFIIITLTSGPQLPWQHCRNEWNTKNCYSLIDVMQNHSEALENRSSPAQEFFERRVLQINQSAGFADMGNLRPELVGCCLIVFIMLYFSLFKGVKSSGKVVWITATAPYIILTILLIRGLFLPGAADGILYYLNPRLEKLFESGVWIDAAVQVFFSIGVGFGVHLTYASFNKFNNNCYSDALITCAVNSLTSFYSGFVIFTFLGYMANGIGKDISNVASEGYGLVFQVYPEAISTLPFAKFWCLLFFVMLITLGIDSAMGGLEAVITGLSDEFNLKWIQREYFTIIILSISFLGSLINCTQGGGYTMFWFDNYSAGVSLLCSALFEAVAVNLYGIERFCDDIQAMIGFRPNIFWRSCWKYVSPLFLITVVISAVVSSKTLSYHSYLFPDWATAMGWALSLSSVSAVPIMFVSFWIKKQYFKSTGRIDPPDVPDATFV